MTADPAIEQKGTQTGGWWRPVALLAVVVTVIVLAKAFGVGERLGELRTWIEGLGVWGPVVFVLLYIVAVVAALPGSALTIAAGAIFGSVKGVICVSIASTIGAALAFLVSRYFAREATANWLAKSERFSRLDQLTEDHGAIIVALTRLVPLFPFNFLNYGFGLTRVRFWTYAFWSWLCMLPGTVLYVVGSDAIMKAISEGKIPWGLVSVVGAMVVALVVIVRMARKRLLAKEAATMSGTVGTGKGG